MPLVYQQNINASTKLGVWRIEEPESFFLQRVTLQRNITSPQKRLQHLSGRYLLQELYPDFPAALIRIADTRKPFLENEAYHFSISHCREYAAVLISRDHRVGVDVELTTEKVETVKHKFLSATEQAHIAEIMYQTPGLDLHRLLTTCWSIKEAMFKWYGEGEIDFKKHLRIDGLELDDNGGLAQCRFLKNRATTLRVHCLHFNGNCLSWVLTNASGEPGGRILVE